MGPVIRVLRVTNGVEIHRCVSRCALFFHTQLASPDAGILRMIGVSPGLNQQELGGRLRMAVTQRVSKWR